MQISAHDEHNKFNTTNNGAVTASTPAWGHSWNAQQNVTAAIVKATGGTYSVTAPVEAETVETKPKTARKTAKK